MKCKPWKARAMESAFLFSHDREQFFYRGQAMKIIVLAHGRTTMQTLWCPGLKKNPKPKGEIYVEQK
jgi:hypothetical protein